MKTLLLYALVAFSLISGQAALAAKKDSNFSAYKGNYKGTITFNSAGTTYLGTSAATISAQKKKEIGSVSVRSILNVDGKLTGFNETYFIRNRALQYMIEVVGSTSGSGNGTVKVGSKQIAYSGTAVIGSDTYTVRGTMKLNKLGKNLSIDETLTNLSSSTTIVVSYRLKKK